MTVYIRLYASLDAQAVNCLYIQVQSMMAFEVVVQAAETVL